MTTQAPVPGDRTEPESPTLVIGEAIADILVGPDGQRRAHPGGSPANVAVGLARLGHPVRLATRLGRDDFGRMVQQHLGGSGVVLSEGSLVDAPTSSATARIDAAGAAHYDFDISWELAAGAVEQARSAGLAHVHTGSIAAALGPGAARVLAAVEAARTRTTVSYDPNLRPALLGTAAAERPRVEQLVSASSVVKVSQEDLEWLCPGQDVHRVAESWAHAGPSLVVLTCGAAGARAWWPHGCYDLPGTPVRVADTVGAGDAFMAGLISGLLRAGLLGADPSQPTETSAGERLRAATAGPRPDPGLVQALHVAGDTAALTCTRPGADPPTRAEVLAWSRRQ